jgi:uncharacterized protein with NRDE domain
MNLTPTDYKFLIEAIQQKANGLMEELKADIEEDIAQACEEVLEFLKKSESKPRGRAPAKKVVRRTRK